MPKSYLYFLALLIFTTTACFSDEDPLFTTVERSLPAITTEGLNTFGCYIDGELFGPLDSPGFAQDPLDAWYTPYSNGGFQLVCIQYNKETKSRKVMYMISNFTGVGNYGFSFIQESFTDFENSKRFAIDTLSPNQIEILHLDIEQAIVSGTFYFTAIAEDYSDTIQVTDGRFDVIVTY